MNTGWFRPSDFFTNRVKTKALILGKGSSKDGEQSKEPEDPNTPHNVATSHVYESYATKYHIPVLDIDMPCALFPSSTEGKFHLYIDCPMTFEEYTKLLTVMAEVGILEFGFVGASIAKGHTALRLPWVKKGDEPLPVLEEVATMVREVEIVEGLV